MEIEAAAWEAFPEQAEVRSLALPSVRVTAGTGETGSRFGGLPWADDRSEWPRTDDGRPLCLVGLLDCDQVNGWLGGEPLPPGLLLNFFFDADEQETWGMSPQDAHYWRIVAADKAQAAPMVAPDGVTVFPAQALDGQPVLTIPHPWEPCIRQRWAEDSAPATAYFKLWDTDPAHHRVFGWPELSQGPMQRDCQLVTGGFDLFEPIDEADPRVLELEQGAEDWRLLWQIDSTDDWMWGDMGKLYFWIRRQDLAAGRFDRVWALIQG
ncbi:DUF1963 domain-containing protein [Actinoplanes bogorensis]|uniref:DUF1963 domain-containing protein n=1 Tax=Paractinoplanes bogorensis TaxID=1610840 RepID=A0ABS5Z0H4_9ACTN|nr:YwqG family protein [Actinoplanes bogorensis]MBU2669152.1 DUF1963 domain-containing protein [Actinoplanes bogorensis]